jgi:hypothetical protein
LFLNCRNLTNNNLVTLERSIFSQTNLSRSDSLKLDSNPWKYCDYSRSDKPFIISKTSFSYICYDSYDSNSDPNVRRGSSSSSTSSSSSFLAIFLGSFFGITIVTLVCVFVCVKKCKQPKFQQPKPYLQQQNFNPQVAPSSRIEIQQQHIEENPPAYTPIEEERPMSYSIYTSSKPKDTSD